MDLQNGTKLVPFIQLAPMEGVLDWTLRELLSEVGGLNRMVTEFIRVTDLLLPDHVFYRYCPELKQAGLSRSGVPVFVQLLGGKPEPLAANAERAVALGALGIDLNFGCPAKTVNRHDGGATLLKEPGRLFQILRAVRAAVPEAVPITAKVRLGFADKNFHREIAAAVEEGGAAQIVVHARTKLEMYIPPAHWEYIRSMREGRKLRFVANGDIWNVQDYLDCVEKSGVHDVALGRGLVRNPLLAHAIRAHTAPFSRLAFLLRFHDENVILRGERFAVVRCKQLLRYWSEGDARAHAWFHEIKRMHDAHQIRNFLTEETVQCPTFKSTPNPIAPTACAPRTYLNARA